MMAHWNSLHPDLKKLYNLVSTEFTTPNILTASKAQNEAMDLMENLTEQLNDKKEAIYDTLDENHYLCLNCKNEPTFFVDGPIENGWEYCPYCGLKIVKVLETNENE